MQSIKTRGEKQRNNSNNQELTSHIKKKIIKKVKTNLKISASPKNNSVEKENKNLDDKIIEEKISTLKNDSKAKDTNHTQIVKTQTKHAQCNTEYGLPFYMNELICYDREKSFPFIINFRQLLYEKLLVNPNEPKTIKSAFMTTFGFESKLLQPIGKISFYFSKKQKQLHKLKNFY